MAGNVVDTDKDGKANGKEIAVDSASYGGVALQTSPFPYPGVTSTTTLSAASALSYIQKSAGASLARDAVDIRLLQELASFGTMGELISDENAGPMSGPGVVKGGTRRVDSDGDGIPDEVEKEMGWDVGRNDAMGDKDGNGYVNVEDWASGIVGKGY